MNWQIVELVLALLIVVPVVIVLREHERPLLKNYRESKRRD